MKPATIARLLDLSVSEVKDHINGFKSELSKITTPIQADEAFKSCHERMEQALLKKWEKLVDHRIVRLKSPLHASRLYMVSPRSRLQAVARKWEVLLIPTLLTPRQAKDAYFNCPAEMEPSILKKWIVLVKRVLSKAKTQAEVIELHLDSPECMDDLFIDKLLKM